MADIAVSETVKDETKCNAYFQGYIKRQLSATTTKKIANLAAVDTGSFMDGYYFEGISTKKVPLTFHSIAKVMPMKYKKI